jgi:hypothetical protein
MSNKPILTQCGGPGQPACPPTPATLILEDGTVLKGKVHKEHGFHHFFEEPAEDFNNAAGEAKFGG